MHPEQNPKHTVKCALVGAGWWGTEAHIPAIKNHPDGQLVAVQKRDPEAADRVARDFAVPFPCTTMEQVLAIEDLDAVVISSTPNAHHAQARAALEHGCHVLIEKPMTLTVAEAEELVEVAQRQSLHFLISCPWHYTAHGIEARQLIQRGTLGRIKMISVLMTNFSGGLYRSLPWGELFAESTAPESVPDPYLKPGRTSYSDPAVAGGGQIYCQVSHAAAHLKFLTGAEPAEVFAHFDNAEAPVDVYDTLDIKLDNGALVAMASTGATMLSERNYEIRIYGTEGMLFMELWKGTMVFHDRAGHVSQYPTLTPEEVYPQYAPAENLIDLARGCGENGSPATLGLTAMRIIEAACRSAATGENVILTETSMTRETPRGR